MKKITLTFLVIAFAINFSYAQYWVGGPTGPIYYGSGSVGIGTTAPATTLDVNGTISAGSMSAATNVFQMDLASSYYGIFDVSYPGQFRWYASPNNSLYKDNALYQLRAWDVGTNTENTILTTTGGGYVGIGTTVPSDRLNVIGTSAYPSGQITLGDGGAVNPYIHFYRWNGSGSNYFQNSIGNNLDASSGSMSFQTGTSSGAAIGADAQTTRMIITQPGNVGIGTTSPAFKLDVQGGNANIYNTGTVTQFAVGGATAGKTVIVLSTSADASGYGALQSVASNGSAWGNTIINQNGGYVGIGTITPDQLLSVNGNIHAQEVLVNLTGFEDQVFKPKYHLLTLPEVKTYIDKNHHLPDVPSEAEVVKNGLNVGSMERTLTKKVEELTLYLIEKDRQLNAQNQKIAQQQTVNDNQKAATKALQKQIDELNKQFKTLKPKK